MTSAQGTLASRPPPEAAGVRADDLALADVLRPEARLALRGRPRAVAARGGGRPALRGRRLLARLAPLRRRRSRDGALERLPVAARRPGDVALGRRAARPLRGASRRCCPRSGRPTIPGFALAKLDAPVAAMLGDQAGGALRAGLHLSAYGHADAGHRAFLWLNVGAEPPRPSSGRAGHCGVDAAGRRIDVRLKPSARRAGNALGPSRVPGLRPDGTRRGPEWSRPHPVVVLAPAGLGTPHWHGADRITILGASGATTAADLAAAALAGVAHQIADALEAVDAPLGGRPPRRRGPLRTRGAAPGGRRPPGLTLEVAAEPEATARGIAALAAEPPACSTRPQREIAHTVVLAPRRGRTGARAIALGEALEVACGWRHERGRAGPRLPVPKPSADWAGAARRPRDRRRDHRCRHRPRRGLARPLRWG